MKMDPIVHFEMPAKNRRRVADFYKKTFGWHMQILGPKMGNYVLAMTTESDEKGPKKPGAINGGFFEYKDEPGFQYPSVVIAVDNLKESVERVKKGGGRIVGKPVDIPGIGQYVAFQDTEGNRVGLLQPSQDM